MDPGVVGGLDWFRVLGLGFLVEALSRLRLGSDLVEIYFLLASSCFHLCLFAALP